MNTKEKLLKNIFGHDSFRNFQEEVVDTILAGNDLLTILPTGGGKSLCYQLPTLLMDGVTVVISPLIALMQDQIKGLEDLNIRAGMISSLQNPTENSATIQALLEGKLKFIYVSPERLSSNDFMEILHRVSINYFVVDEAHCVSGWGHEFRSEYRNLSRLKQYFPNTPIAAFTATATKKVEADICQSLQLHNPKHFRAKTQRDNLEIFCENRITDGKTQILSFLQIHKGLSGIIYTFTRKESETLAFYLCEKGYSAKAYHAGLTNQTKNEVYEDFIYEKIDIVVATVAFGMGIDKSNIRFVIHTSLPKTLENYYQEIGRAGRDGAMSYVYLLFSKSDEIKRKIQIDEAIDSEYKQTGLDKLATMYRYATSENCRHKLIANYFEDEIEKCGTLCDNCTKGEVALEDITTDAQKLLSAIYRSGQYYGLGHIIDILKGSKSQKIIEANHQTLSVYGIGDNLSKNEWMVVGDKLIDMEALSVGQFRVLKLTPLGLSILKGDEKVLISSSRLQINKHTQELDATFGSENTRFERFKSLRKELALNHQVPAYVIFGDKVLEQLSSILPQTKEAMLEINGVGEVKFEKYGEPFLALSQELKEEKEVSLANPATPKKLTKTYLETLQLIEESKTLKEIAQIRQIAITTVLSHIEVLLEYEKITIEEKIKLLEPISIPDEIKEYIEVGLKLTSGKELRQYMSLYEYLYLGTQE